MKTPILITALLFSLTIGCAGPRAFTKGTYEDPEPVALLDDRFNENSKTGGLHRISILYHQ